MLLEMAIGDAYGIGFEFCKPAHTNDLAQFYRHPTYDGLEPGQYSDDTQRALANVRVVMTKNPLSFIDYMNAYVEEYKISPRNGYSRGFQSLIMSCENGQDMMDKISPSRATNGSVMGIAPLGYIENITTLKRAATIQALTTHNALTVEWAQVAALTAHYFLYNLGSKENLIGFLYENVDFTFDYDLEAEVFDMVGPCTMQAKDTVLHALKAVLEYDNLADMLKYCIDLKGDTDSLGAVAMALGSVCKEIENNLPHILRNTLENNGRGHDYIVQLDNVLNNVYFPNTWIAKDLKK